MVWSGQDLKDHPVPSPCHGFNCSMALHLLELSSLWVKGVKTLQHLLCAPGSLHCFCPANILTLSVQLKQREALGLLGEFLLNKIKFPLRWQSKTQAWTAEQTNQKDTEIPSKKYSSICFLHMENMQQIRNKNYISKTFYFCSVTMCTRDFFFLLLLFEEK